jgi:quercetin dioxygenase-like cupin family protein
LRSFRPSLLLVLTLILAPTVQAQLSEISAKTLVACKPVAERTGEQGCWILGSQPLGVLESAPVYWTLDTFPDREAAEKAESKNSTVLESLGKIWLLTVAPESKPAANAKRVASIGPIPIKSGEDYTAQYAEAIMAPGGTSRTHVHSGAEVFYTEAGETCLETPSGVQISRPGPDSGVVIPEGLPMELVATGTENRRGLVLVLHSSSKPATTVVTDWHSKGLCRAANPH